jgi:hypothetical protein
MSRSMSETPLHQWTDGGEYVLLLKTVNQDGTSYDGFQWPESGPVGPAHWSRNATCESGGLFGWPWGAGIGDGKDAHASDRWIVFRARPENVIDVCGKAKAVPGEDGALPEVIYSGNMADAISVVNRGWMRWVFSRAEGQAAASGESGQAAASGWSGQAAASGLSGQAAASGWRGQAAASGEGGVAVSRYRALAGPEGAFIISWYNGEHHRHAVGIVGQDGIEPGVWYEVRDGVLVAVNDA